MTSEEVARRYQYSRPGFYLADYAGVGLPIYDVTIQVLTLSRKPLPPIEEFALKCIDRGLRSTPEIAEFLGLDERVVKTTLVGLAQIECIALLSDHGSRMQFLQLTRKGRLTLDGAQTEEPEEREVRVHYDGLLRKAAWYDRFPTMKYEQLRSEHLFEITAFPPKRPQLADMEVREIERIVRALGNPEHYKRDLLAVKQLERVQKRYLSAVALVYAANDGSQVQVAFAVDGRLSGQHELEYARMDGPRKQGIDKGIRSSFASLEVGKPLREQFGVSNPELLQKERAAADAKLAVEASRAALETADNELERTHIREKLGELAEAQKKAENELREVPIRNLYTFDHPPLLEYALTHAERRLLVISPWITGAVVDSGFLAKLEVLLKKSVSVYLGYGIREQPTRSPDPRDQEAKDRLSGLARQFPNFRFRRLGNTHAKVLIKDTDFAAVSSFNWLSFRGDPNRTFRDEQGVLVQDPQFVDRKFEELLSRFSVSE